MEFFLLLFRYYMKLKIRTHSRLALDSDYIVLAGALGLEPANIIFNSNFSKEITTFNRRFIVLYKLTITYKIKKVCYKTCYENIIVRHLKILHYT